jgi:DNA polymerase-3 subunit delta'
MPLIPLYGHASLRKRLARSAASGRLPSSLLLHGPAGIGKQRLALWLTQLLLCPAEDPPCGACQHCRYMAELQHPDLHWLFPRPRLKDSDPDPDDVRDDYREAVVERVAGAGLYEAPSGSEGIFIAAVRSLTRDAMLAPALAARKVFVIGDAERMVSQEGADQAANALLKLLEEPPADTFFILTSSEPAALLPTIRSRVAAVRVPRLTEKDVAEFLQDPAVRSYLKKAKRPEPRADLLGGAPGRVLNESEDAQAITVARRMLDAAAGRTPERFSLALTRGVSNARGAFTDSLDALTVLLSERTREAVARDDRQRAARLAAAADLVEVAKERAAGNVNPQLLTAKLVLDLSEHLS